MDLKKQRNNNLHSEKRYKNYHIYACFFRKNAIFNQK